MARLARTSDQMRPDRYGRRKPRRRRKMRTQPPRLASRAAAMEPSAPVWHTRGPMSDAIALRNRFAMVKGAWDEHLRAAPFPPLADATAEKKIESIELALVDEMRRRATPETAEQ